MTTIGREAFRECKNLTDVTLPEGLTTIGDYAFYICPALTNVTLPESLTTIDHMAFSCCDALTTVTIPENLTTIDDRAFYNCRALTSFAVAADNPAYTAVDGVLFNKDKTTLVLYPMAKPPRTTYNVPDGVTTIGDNAFGECDVLTNVTLPDGLTTIGDWAFYNCDALTNVTFPASLTTLSENAFDDEWYGENDQAEMISVRFLGDVPQTGDASYVNGPFANRTLTICYPKENDTWTDEAKAYLTRDALDVTWVGVRPGDEVCMVTVPSTRHGKVTVTPRAALAGTQATLTVTPDEGYELDRLIVTQADGTEVAVTDNTFTMPASDVTVVATFKRIMPSGGKSGTMVEPTGQSLDWAVTETGQLSIDGELDRDEAVLAACYDQTGRFVGLRWLDAQHTNAQVDQADSLRLFWLDAKLRPIAPKTTVWGE